jgi:hypothetical protein
MIGKLNSELHSMVREERASRDLIASVRCTLYYTLPYASTVAFVHTTCTVSHAHVDSSHWHTPEHKCTSNYLKCAVDPVCRDAAEKSQFSPRNSCAAAFWENSSLPSTHDAQTHMVDENTHIHTHTHIYMQISHSLTHAHAYSHTHSLSLSLKEKNDRETITTSLPRLRAHTNAEKIRGKLEEDALLKVLLSTCDAQTPSVSRT